MRPRRRAARVVLLDRASRVLLINSSDPLDQSKPPWWEIPGGGMDRGEESQDTAKRELYEECGFRDVEVGPCIWTQYVEFDFAMYHFKSDERIHVAYTEVGGEWNPQGLEALEAAAFDQARWWTLDELLAVANSLPFGLAAYIYSEDLEAAWALADRLEFGAVGINVSDTSELQAPFGGWKLSGFGRELGIEGLHTFLEPKHIKMRVKPWSETQR